MVQGPKMLESMIPRIEYQNERYPLGVSKFLLDREEAPRKDESILHAWTYEIHYSTIS